ncbi:sulfite exporter TauE/SafE family protein [Alphaproteobacteria bacterium]|nr:sulfite exporter TauE/SafE family protein [Alphaproteobacteria bacterium]
MTFEPSIVFVVGLTFLLAGLVKGVIGMGLPTVSLGLLTAVVGLPQAMALLIIPSLVTNFWQGVVGGNLLGLLKKHWLFFLSATASIGLGAYFGREIGLAYLSALLGMVLIVYAAINLLGVRFVLSAKQGRWSAPVFGIANGVLTGLTGSFVMPGVPYLQALGLDRNQLVQAMGVLFTFSTLGLAIALWGNNRITSDLAWLSLIGLVPAIIGMIIGQKIRHRLSEIQFRRVFFWSMLIIGAYIAWKAF